MKKICFLFLCFFPFTLGAYFSADCGENILYRVENITENELTVSSFYCHFWQNKKYKLPHNFEVKTGNFFFYDGNDFSQPTREDLQNFIIKLKKDFKRLQHDHQMKHLMIHQFILHAENHENIISEILKKQILTSLQREYIQQEIQRKTWELFEKTYGERLLMDGRIISREQWWADESYSKKEMYLAGCEDGSCFSSSSSNSITTLRANYMEYFHLVDQANQKIKTFSDGRDPVKYYPVDRIIIHHTAGWYKANSEEWTAYMKAVHKYHALRLRWTDIGYHYLIDGEGNIYEGRAGGKYAIGSHVTTHNFWTIGISLMTNDFISEKMQNSLSDLIVYLAKEYRLSLDQPQIVRKSDLSWFEKSIPIYAHKELDTRKPKDPELDMNTFRQKIALHFLLSYNQKEKKN